MKWLLALVCLVAFTSCGIAKETIDELDANQAQLEEEVAVLQEALSSGEISASEFANALVEIEVLNGKRIVEILKDGGSALSDLGLSDVIALIAGALGIQIPGLMALNSRRNATRANALKEIGT